MAWYPYEHRQACNLGHAGSNDEHDGSQYCLSSIEEALEAIVGSFLPPPPSHIPNHHFPQNRIFKCMLNIKEPNTSHSRKIKNRTLDNQEGLPAH